MEFNKECLYLGTCMFVGNAFECLLDTYFLPRVLHQQDVQQEVEVRPQLVGVHNAHLPQELVEDGM